MKKTVLFLITGIAIVAMFSFKLSEEKDKSLARVQRVQGKYVYIYSEPLTEYDIVFNLDKSFVFASSNKIDDIVPACLSKCLKISEKQNKDFDGVIFNLGDKQTAIKFK